MLTIRVGRRAAFLVVLGLVLGIPLGAWASHQFTDVPDSNVFHADISWLADAGVTKGCNPPANDRFCPSDPVTREQMAAFMHRLAINQVVDADTVDGMDASAFALQSDLPKQGGASCPGAGFYPPEEVTDYTRAAPRSSSSGQTILFFCALQIPDGATITGVTASLNDTSSSFDSLCRLQRMDVTGGRFGLGNGTLTLLATTNSTTGSFGNQTVSTTAIADPVVDARRYSYIAGCIAGDVTHLGINGVVIAYTLP